MADETKAQDVSSETTGVLSRLARITGTVVVPITAVTAILVYFGWARTSATYQIFGIDRGVLGFSIQDYLFGSVVDTFNLLALLLLVILVAVPAHLGLIGVTTEPKWRKRAALCLALVGLALTVVGLLGFLEVVIYQVLWPLVPLSLGLGVGLVGYAVSLWRAATGTKFRPLGDSYVINVVSLVAFAAFLTLTLFWSLAIYAGIHGAREAQRIAQQPASLPGVVVFSPDPLFLHGSRIRETVLIGDQGRRYYRYDGLHLLVRADGRYILLPENWRPGMRAMILPDDPAVRLELFWPVGETAHTLSAIPYGREGQRWSISIDSVGWRSREESAPAGPASEPSAAATVKSSAACSDRPGYQRPQRLGCLAFSG